MDRNHWSWCFFKVLVLHVGVGFRLELQSCGLGLDAFGIIYIANERSYASKV